MMERIKKKRKRSKRRKIDTIFNRKRKRSKRNKKYHQSNLVNILHDDLLVEILIRVADCVSMVRCSSVCKHWNSIINSIHYRRQKLVHHSLSQSLLPSTILFREADTGIITTPVCEYFSNESQIIHQRGSSSELSQGYLDFLPWDNLHVYSSYEDLLLLGEHHCRQPLLICNPFTRQWLELPDYNTNAPRFGPEFGGLVCRPNKPQQLKLDHQYEYKVILIAAAHEDNYKAITFCSETGRWTQPILLSSNYERGLNFNAPFVSNGMLHWLAGVWELNSVNAIMSLDPFRDTKQDPKYCRFINLPSGIHQGREYCNDISVRIGLVRGQLRLSQLIVTEEEGFVLKIWELSYANGDGDDDVKWTLVHDVRVKAWTERLFVIAFHPENENVIFLLYNKCHIYQYHIGRKTEKIGEAHSKYINFLLGDLRICTLVHPLWPTPIYSLPSPSLI